MAQYYVYEGPADKLDLSPIFGPDKVLYPANSGLAAEDGATAGEPVEFNDDEIEELRTNPALNGHRFRQVSAETVKEQQAAKKATEERRARLEKAREKAEARSAAAQPQQVRRLLNGTPVDVAGASFDNLPDAGTKRSAARSKADTEAGGDAAGSAAQTATTGATPAAASAARAS